MIDEERERGEGIMSRPFPEAVKFILSFFFYKRDTKIWLKDNAELKNIEKR